MNLDQIETKCFILALFIRDDGERFLLGSRAYEFVDSQLHFTANAYQNDIVEVQGNDGVMLAGQVRRGQSQAFDGYIGDSSVDRSTIEQYRQNFLKFFRKNHYYKVVYIFTDGSAIQRRQGFIVEAPEVKELYQLFPQYHISMNFEDINYYEYKEDEDGQEIYGESATLKVATSATGGLIWEDGSETTLSGEGSNFTLNGTIDGNGISNVQLKGDTTQQTYSGKNLLSVLSATGTNNGITWTRNVNSITVTGSSTNTQAYRFMDSGGSAIALPTVIPAGTYTLSRGSVSGAGSGQTLNFQFRDANDNVLLANQRIGGDTPSITITLASDAYSFRVAIEGLAQNTPVDIAYNDIQLEAGSTATSFEPYVGGIPAPNPDYPQTVNTVTGQQVIDVYNKNLFDGVYLNTFIGGSGDSNYYIQNASTRSAIVPCEPNTTYTISRGSITSRFTFADYPIYPIAGTAESNSPQLNNRQVLSASALSATVTTSANAKYMVVYVSNTSQEPQLQIELGSTATPYQTHQSYEVNLGKNLLDITTWQYGYYNASGAISGTGSQENILFDYIPVTPSTIYTASSSNSIRFNFAFFDSFKTFISRDPMISGTSTSRTITTPQNAAYMRLWVWKGGESWSQTDVDNGNFQIEKGSTATSYASYFTPIELCKIGTYQDRIYKSGSDWYVHKETAKVVFNGSESWEAWTAQSQTNTYGVRLTTLTPAIVNIGSTIDEVLLMADNFTRYRQSPLYATDIEGIATANSNIYIRVDKDRLSAVSVAGFTNWLNDNNVTLYYALATPTDTQITNTALIAQLEALAGATTYDGKTVFTVTSENQLGILSLSSLVIAGGGVVWDNYGAEWEEGTGGGPTMISVDSIDNVYPVWELTGPAVNPQISVLTTNTTLTYTGSITASQTLSIDMFNKTATLNGTSVIGNVSGDWVYLKPGINRVTYTTNNADAPDSTIWWQEIVG